MPALTALLAAAAQAAHQQQSTTTAAAEAGAVEEGVAAPSVDVDVVEVSHAVVSDGLHELLQRLEQMPAVWETQVGRKCLGLFLTGCINVVASLLFDMHIVLHRKSVRAHPHSLLHSLLPPPVWLLVLSSITNLAVCHRCCLLLLCKISGVVPAACC